MTTDSRANLKKCHTRVLNLYLHLNGEKSAPNSMWVVKEILETEKCQSTHDLRQVRDTTLSLLHELSPGSVKDGLAKPDVCSEVVAHHSVWYQQEVLNSLRYRTQAYYKFREYYEPISLVVSVLFGGTVFWQTGNAALASFATFYSTMGAKLLRRSNLKK